MVSLKKGPEFYSFGFRVYYDSPNLESNRNLWIQIPDFLEVSDKFFDDAKSNVQNGIIFSKDFVLQSDGYFTVNIYIKDKVFFQQILHLDYKENGRFELIKKALPQFILFIFC